MSGLNLDITYNDVVNTIYNWIIANCKNIGSVNLPDCYKSGYNAFFDTEGTWTQGNDHAYRPGFYISVSNYVSGVSAPTVRDRITSFFTQQCYLPNNFGLVVHDSEFLDLMFDIMIFITNYCCLVSSPFSETLAPQETPGNIVLPVNNSSKYLIFNDISSITTTNIRNLSGASNPSSEKKILASDFDAMFNILFMYINNTIKVKPIKYTVSFNG